MLGITDMWLKALLGFAFARVGVVLVLFPPRTAAQAREVIEHIINRAPSYFGFLRTRWTLRLIANNCDWLADKSLSSVSRLLKQLGIRYKRGRQSLHSPDPSYDQKCYRLAMCGFRAKYHPSRYALLYLDEMTYYRQPKQARAYALRGHHQQSAALSHRSNTKFRVIGALNAVTGQTLTSQHYRINLPILSQFYRRLAQAYPQAETIYVVLDNWPVHFHPDVLACLEPQQFQADFHTPDNWPTQPSARAIHDNLPIQLVPLPTYAPWLNPIEKLWLWLYQDVLFMHRDADQWDQLRLRVQIFLNTFQVDSATLLRYVGLLPDYF